MVKIFVVEDNHDYQELLQNFPESAGHEVKTSYDGARALELVREHSFDLVLLDLMLPKIDGFGVLEAIRKNCNAPVIMLTALGGEGYQMRGYLQKIDAGAAIGIGA